LRSMFANPNTAPVGAPLGLRSGGKAKNAR
jgi:hypothetical protein